MSRKAKAKEIPHIGLAVFATGVMALALGVGVVFLRIIDRIDGFFESAFQLHGMDAPTRALDAAVYWMATAFLAFALPAVMLNIPGAWRRVIVWVVTISLTLAWGPVLVLASYKPEIGVALIAVLWSGFCAMIYAHNHVLPVDAPEKSNNPGTNGPR